MKNLLLLFSIISISLTSCIKDDIIDDYVEPTIRITSMPETIVVGDAYQFEFAYLNNIGQEEDVSPTWSSSDESILIIDQNGLSTPIQKGEATITVSYFTSEINVSESFTVTIGEILIEESEEKKGTIVTTSSYVLEGDFEIKEEDGKLIISIAENYKASTALPGLFIYLTNNTTTTSGAYEIGAVQIFEGDHSYEIEDVDINDYSHLLYFCKPFNVKVGDGQFN